MSGDHNMYASGNQPAFPQVDLKDSHGMLVPDRQAGMTLRDYFAAHAPEPSAAWRGGDRKPFDIVAWRWWYADEMLKQRGESK